MERQIDSQLQQGEEDLIEKKDILNKQLNQNENENTKLRKQISVENDNIKTLEHEICMDKLKEENLELKIQNQVKISQNSQQTIDTAQNFLQKFAEDKPFYLGQSQIENSIDQLVKNCSDNNDSKQKEQNNCESEIDDRAVMDGKVKKQKTEIELEEKMGALKQLNEKTLQLKNILNSIFQQDSTVMKLISDKKVYLSQDKQNKPKNAEVKNKDEGI